MGYLKEDHPDIFAELDTQKNQNIDIERLTSKSNKRVVWVCPEGHHYDAVVVKRTTRGNGCPYCSGRRVLEGFNDFATLHPELLKFFSSENNDLKPTEFSPGKNTNMHWNCHLGHSFVAKPGSVVSAFEKSGGKSVGCPYCSGRKVLPGFNDLATTHPDIVQEWDYSKNDITPSKLSKGSSRKVWWICNRGHSYNESPNKRTHGRGCPYCAGKRASKENSLRSSPSLCNQWDHTKNTTLSIDDVTLGSGVMAWWVCENGHSWRARVADRKRFGCPHCTHKVSQGEKDLVDTLRFHLGDMEIVTNTRSVIPPKELDIYIPDKKIAVEFNGLYWHTEEQGKDKRYHYDKWRACANQGIQLITVWEDDWENHRDLVVSMLLHKLGASDRPVVYARKTIIDKAIYKESARFCDMHHIQGAKQGTVHYVLRDQSGTIVACSVWTQRDSTLYLDRYCTSATVVGGMGKLIHHVTQWGRQRGCTKIVTFSDNEVSDGGLYNKLGFTLDTMMEPDYKYLYKGELVHKFNFRKQRFKNDPDLRYDPAMTESELAKLNGIPKVWDCGKTRWALGILTDVD